MIFTDRKITIRNGKSTINEPVVLYRGDYEVSIKFTIMESKFRFKSGVNLVDSEKASHGQLAILAPYGGNVFSEIVKCEDGTVTFTLTKEMIDQLEEVGLYSFQIRLFDYYRESRVSIPPVEFGIEVREPVASEDHDNEVNNAIVGYSIAKVVDGLNEDVGDTFDNNGDYNKTEWKTGDRISEGKLNKIEDALDKINRNEKADVEALDKRVTNNFNVLENNKAEQADLNLQKTRIDNIVSLAAGSTTGDAELTDARLSFNNIQYDNLGESIREQMMHLNNKIVYSTDNNRVLNNDFEPLYVKSFSDVLSDRILVGDGNGYITNKEGWSIKRYHIIDTKYVYISTSGGYQFQTELSCRNINIEVDRNKPINIVGDPVIGSVSSVVKVPSGAIYLAVCVPTSEVTDPHVFEVANIKDRQNAIDITPEQNEIDTSITLDACGEFPAILSNVAPTTHECPTAGGDTVCSLTYHEFIDMFFGCYVGVKFDDGYKVSKRSLGRDSSNMYDVFEYDFCPPRYNRTVLLSSGMNANELPGEFGLAYFMKEVMESSEDGYRYLRNNVRFKIIPVLCPWSFDQTPILYDNFNGVSLNQNFDYRGSWATVSGAGSDRKGEYACDQAETKIILKWLNENAYKAELWIDAHTSPFGITGTANLYYTVASDSVTISKVNEAQTKMTRAYIDNGYFTEGTDKTGNSAFIAPANRYPKHLYSFHECGIPSIMIEQYTGNPLYGGVNHLSNTKADIDNYVTMLRAYTLVMLKRASQTINITELYWKIYQMYNELHSLDNHTRNQEYELGTLATGTGLLMSRNDRCARKPVYVNPGDNIILFTDNDYSIVELHEYRDDGSWIKLTRDEGSPGISLTASSSTSYIRYAVKRSDGADMNPAELAGKVSLAINGVSVDKNDIFDYGTINGSGVIALRADRAISKLISLTGNKTIELINFDTSMYSLVDVAVYNANGDFIKLDSAAKRVGFGNKVVIYTKESDAAYVRFSLRRGDSGDMLIADLNSIKIIVY